jgi:hypothetical protein
VSDTVDDFSKQFNVMLERTGSVRTEDIESVVPKSSTDGSILVTVTLTSLQAAVEVTKAVEGRHLSVYIDGKGYVTAIAPLPHRTHRTHPPFSSASSIHDPGWRN